MPKYPAPDSIRQEFGEDGKVEIVTIQFPSGLWGYTYTGLYCNPSTFGPFPDEETAIAAASDPRDMTDEYMEDDRGSIH